MVSFQIYVVASKFQSPIPSSLLKCLHHPPSPTPSPPTSTMSLSIFSRSSGTLPDQPITNLPASEEAAIATLSSRLTIFTTKILHPTDPWLSLAYAEQKRLLLRFLRFHLLNVPKAENHILRVCCWRTSTRPWTLPLRVLRGRAVGLPLCHPSGRGREKEVLIFLPASQYVRADVDHAKQQVAVKAFFEFCAYADDGLRASAAVLLIDFGDLQMRNVDLASARYSIKLFMDYYPEVFCKILFINYPKWFYGSKFYIFFIIFFAFCI